MMTSSNENFFRVTGHLCGEFIGPRGIPRTKGSELWCFLWSASEQTVEETVHIKFDRLFKILIDHVKEKKKKREKNVKHQSL